MNKINFLTVAALGLLFLLPVVSCDDDNPNPVIPPDLTPIETTGAYILNNGVFGNNNSSVSYYDTELKRVRSTMFYAANSRGLGDTAQDILVYGGKTYIAVFNSNRIEVVDTWSMESIATISPVSEEDDNTETPQYPRTLIAQDNYVYASLYDGYVCRIDTTSLILDKEVAVGRNPEYMAISGNQLFVANSGGMDHPDYDNRVSVINLLRFSHDRDIEVEINPSRVVSDSSGDVYVISLGNYEDIPNTFQRIAGRNDAPEVIEDMRATLMTIHNDTIYAIHHPIDGSTIEYIQYDALKETVITRSFLTDGSMIQSPNCIDVDPITGNIYIGDALDYVTTGTMYVFSPEGELIDSFNTDISPIRTSFITNR